MLGTEIELLISDFDGTLVDTFSANYMAYQKPLLNRDCVCRRVNIERVLVFVLTNL